MSILLEHIEQTKDNGSDQVDRVHYSRTGIHAHTAYIFGNTVHHIPGAVCFIKVGIELLVVSVNFILLVIFNVAAHDNNGLPHEEHKKAAKQCKRQNNNAAKHHQDPKIPCIFGIDALFFGVAHTDP